jgi:pilus assembly protein FimV
LKQRSTTVRFALTGVAVATACLWGSTAWSLGLGQLNVQSALGEALRAEIEITSLTAEEAATLQMRVGSADTYRASGLELNPALAGARVEIVRLQDGRSIVRVLSERAVLEPFVDLVLEATWASGRLIREYTLLLDPPTLRQAQAAPAAPTTPAVIGAAPQPLPAPAAQPAAPPAAPPAPARAAPVAPPPAVASAPLPPPAPRPPAPPVAAAPAAPSAAESVRVRPGDTLSGIAARTQPAGVSLDQMLVALFRANPQAFMGENMNRLRSGAVLSVPTADEVAGVAPSQARELIVAQSQDFDAYRQRLAAGTTTRAAEAPSRLVTGQVQAQVQDRREGEAPPTDRLTLSQEAAQPGSPEAQASAQGEQRDSAARLAELSRNVEELRRLQSAAEAAAAGTAIAPAAPAAAPGGPAVVAQAPAEPPAPPAPTVASPAPPPAAPPAPPAAAPAPPAPAEAGFVDSLLQNPLLLPGAGVLIALLAGVGLWRMRSRRKASEETSFIESRLQNDSFFGASGGQRIDTHESASSSSATSTGASSTSYSLSQLDAIGDVDPVQEADVYLAYGRDLQAEEILKEAMRADPERMAVRSKLLEVYAKRRDAKGFELLATQVFNLTGGAGDDWAHAQVLGRSIDPDNALYAEGGRPAEVLGASGEPVEALGASTLPYTAPAPKEQFQPDPDATLSGGLDLELDAPGTPAGPGAAESTRPLTPDVDLAPAHDNALDFDLGAVENEPVTRTAPGALDTTPAPLADAGPTTSHGALDFDLSEMGDLGGGEPPRPPEAPAKPADDTLSAAEAFSADLPELPSADEAAGNLGQIDEVPMLPEVSEAPELPEAPESPRAAEPTAPGALDAASDFGNFQLDNLPLEEAAPANGGADQADALGRKLELAEEFRQIGDLEGARELLEEVVSKSDGVLRSKAQGMLDSLG